MACNEEDLLELETRRCAAISAGNPDLLRDTLSEDYVHVHATGKVGDREDFIAGVLANPRIVERGRITMRFYGDVAVLIGDQTNRKGASATNGVLQQIAARGSGTWRFVSAQITRKP